MAQNKIIFVTLRRLSADNIIKHKGKCLTSCKIASFNKEYAGHGVSSYTVDCTIVRVFGCLAIPTRVQGLQPTFLLSIYKQTPIKGCMGRVKLIYLFMKKSMLMLMVIIMYSLSTWAQTEKSVSPVVVIGNKALQKSTFSEVKALFNREGLNIMEDAPSNSDTFAVGMDLNGTGKYALMWTIEAYTNKKMKEVTFLCGSKYWDNIEHDLKSIGFSFVKKDTATLGNGIIVPQQIYKRGENLCLVQVLDNGMANIIFKKSK